MKLPKGGTGIVAAAKGMDGHIKTSDKDERMICYIVNTAEYCHKTAGELAKNVSKIIDTQLANAVDMSEVQDELLAVITKSLVTLVNGLETKFDVEMAAMTRVPWGTLESVGDQSEYVNTIKMILNGSITVLGSLLSPVYFQLFLDKDIQSRGQCSSPAPQRLSPEGRERSGNQDAVVDQLHQLNSNGENRSNDVAREDRRTGVAESIVAKGVQESYKDAQNIETNGSDSPTMQLQNSNLEGIPEDQIVRSVQSEEKQLKKRKRNIN